MKYFFLTFLILVTQVLICQDYSKDTLVIKEVLATELRNEDSIVYTDKIEDWIINFIKKELDNYIDNGANKHNYDQLLKIGEYEKDSLNKQIEELRNFKWRDSLIHNAKAISIDSIRVFIRNYDRSLPQEKEEPNTVTTICRRGPILFSFSKPMYIRNETICLIYIRKLSRIYEGNEELSFYKKDEEKWVKWITLYSSSF
ncbi:MAG: hypothetical protein IPI45_14180 [Saprospiraceae bacterium]|nr:hypothetical protein [Saprospiraceae bacterium]MBK7738915.1 hypothetical protein [Saprospiraceae bacterium]MBK7912518.1 hypothetical protein [Saprospiraceae bacterium]